MVQLLITDQLVNYSSYDKSML